MTSIRFGRLIIAVCGSLMIVAGIQVGIWQYQAAQLSVKQEVISAHIGQFHSAAEALLDLETGQRGYLLTGKEAYLEPYTQGLRSFADALANLQLSFHDDPATLDKINVIAKIAQAKKDELERTIQLRRNAGLAAALEVVQSDEGKGSMDVLRDKFSFILVQLRDERSELAAAINRQFANVSALGALVIALVVLFVAFAFQRLTGSIRDLDKLQRLREHEAMHDALTTLPNRRYLNEWLNITLAGARRTGQALLILYFDLDGFKAVNDQHGHAAGDRVLQVTATRLRACMRSSDFVARLGGDEFVAVLPDIPAPAALSALLERLRGDLAKAPIAELDDSAVSASIGVARYPEQGDTPDALLASADRAMYEVKQSRRQRPRPSIVSAIASN